MVNMYGAGNAFNLRFQQRTVMPQITRTKTAPMPQRIGFGDWDHTTQTISFKGANQGWNLAGLLCGIFGGVFGMLNTQTTSFHQQSQATQQQDDKLSNLRHLYSKFNIVPEGNGKYSATDADGNLIAEDLSYEDMRKALDAKKKEANGKPDGKQPVTPDGKQPVTPDGEQPVKPDGEQPVKPDGEQPVTPEGEQPVTPGETPTVNRNNNVKGNKNGDGISLKGWYKAYGGNAEGNKGMKLSTCKNAQEVCNMILKAKMDYLSNEDRAALTKEIISKNPSVFDPNTGAVLPGAKWDKLDLPSIDYIKTKYVANKETVTDTNGNVSYVSNTTEEVSTQRSDITRDNIASQQGFSKTKLKDIYQKNGHFYKYADSKFTPLTTQEIQDLTSKIKKGNK